MYIICVCICFCICILCLFTIRTTARGEETQVYPTSSTRSFESHNVLTGTYTPTHTTSSVNTATTAPLPPDTMVTSVSLKPSNQLILPKSTLVPDGDMEETVEPMETVRQTAPATLVPDRALSTGWTKVVFLYYICVFMFLFCGCSFVSLGFKKMSLSYTTFQHNVHHPSIL